ncbi:hypothetical protein PDIDSM_2469 [Penicillium digitatum]|nr:hypothetical protein PDIDSM_2469 [Penicillium digitatum]
MSDRTKKMETQIQLAVKAFSQANKPNIAQLGREFDVPYHRLRARIHGRQSYTDRATITRSLNSIQEKALTSWVQSLDSAYTSPTAEMVEGAANAILKKAGEDRVVGHNWAYHFITRLPPGFNYIIQYPKEKSRVMKHHQFLPHEIFNWDETGYRIGKGKARKVITSRTTSYIATGGQSESITGIECISADGWLMLPWFLPKGNTHMEEWYENITTTDFRIKPTTNGWIDDETALQWLFSFHEATIKMMVKRQDADAKKLKRLQAKQAKELEAQQRAQEARDLLEAEHEASMAARDSHSGNWFIDSHGGYM